MSSSIVERDQARDALPVRTWLIAVSLLIAELILGIFIFDSERLPIASDTNVFRYLGESMPLIAAVMTATLMLLGIPADAERKEIARVFREPRRIWPLLVAHLLAYALALAINIFVFNAGLESQRPWLWIALWAACSLASISFLLAAVVPLAAVRSFAKPLGRALAAGSVVGLLALLAGATASLLWRPMSQLTLEIVVFLLDFTGHEVMSIPEELVVATPRYGVIIDRPCSGYEGIGLITVLLGFYLLFSRSSLRFPNALLILPMGMALIWIANSVRIAALIAVGTWISPEIANGGFHSAAGWLLFCLITLSLVYVSRGSEWFAVEGGTKRSFRTPEGAYLLPLLFLIGTALATALLSSTGFDYLYPLRVLTPLIPLWLFRNYYEDLRWTWSWAPILLGAAVFVVWVALGPPADPETVYAIPEALAEMPKAAAAIWLIARVLGAVVLVPIVEELAFRGYLLRRLIDADFTKVSPRQFTVVSFAISSIAFGVLHGRWLAGIVAGMLYALAQYRRGEISDAIVAHAVTNGLLAFYVLALGQWAFW